MFAYNTPQPTSVPTTYTLKYTQEHMNLKKNKKRQLIKKASLHT
jgi:hypothetical protein